MVLFRLGGFRLFHQHPVAPGHGAHRRGQHVFTGLHLDAGVHVHAGQQAVKFVNAHCHRVRGDAVVGCAVDVDFGHNAGINLALHSVGGDLHRLALLDFADVQFVHVHRHFQVG